MRWHHSKSEPELDPTEVERIVASNVALARHLSPVDTTRLIELTLRLAATKRWEPVAPLELTSEMAVTIAANAAIPILNLDLSLYRSVRSVIVRPTTVTSTGKRAGPVPGVATDEPMSTIGQAAPHSGPMSISWDAALTDSRHPAAGRNVVIHEFAHKIDMGDGYSDGTPPLRGAALENWTSLLADEFERPDSRPGDEVLRPYAWTNAAEFFAVATETFFCTPTRLASAKPALYAALVGLYRQEPATR